MSFFDAFRGRRFKSELEQVTAERDQLRAALADTERMTYAELQGAIQELTLQCAQLQQEAEALRTKYVGEQAALEQQLKGFRARLQAENADLERQVQAKKGELVETDDQILMQSFGIYKPKYDLQSSDAYRERLEKIRKQQEALVKAGRATVAPTNWTVNNSKTEGDKMVRDYVKLIVRSFNNECDASIVSVKFNNVETIRKRIEKAFETLNTLGKRIQISLVPEYLKLKLEELYLCHEYQMKKQEEKEQQRAAREKEREDAKAAREIEEKKLLITKERKHFLRGLKTVSDQLLTATDEVTRALLEQERAAIEQNLQVLAQQEQDVLHFEQNTRAGHVYVISNIGAFGEGVFKIGVTRRLDPQERIDELGDASVPFDFDIHALIFSEDAPALESALHRAFEDRRLNLINRRREFFRASLQEIDDVVKRSFGKPYEFTQLADAREYRESLVLKESASPPKVTAGGAS